jgi:Zn-dependent M28 family amino/carboxypeptidase
MPFSKPIRLLAMVAIFAATTTSAQIRFKQLPIETIQSRLEMAKSKNSEREQTLKQMFIDAGCPSVTEAKVKGDSDQNVICLLPGKSDRTIVVGGHFDHVKVGDGVVDNWSGASLLPSLMQSILGNAREHTVVFIGFTAEEKGLVGSKAYVKDLGKEGLAKISAMVNFDTLGLAPTEVWATHGNAGLVNALFQIAAIMKLPLSIMNVDGPADSDSQSFREKKIPALTIHSLTQDTAQFLHSPKDTIDAIKIDDYYTTYRLSAAYLVMLDQGLDKKVPADGAPAQATGESKSQ